MKTVNVYEVIADMLLAQNSPDKDIRSEVVARKNPVNGKPHIYIRRGNRLVCYEPHDNDMGFDHFVINDWGKVYAGYMRGLAVA